MKGESDGAGFCGGFVAQWLWRLQSDTLGSSPAVAGFSLFSFLPEQVDFQRNFCKFLCLVLPYREYSSYWMSMRMR